MCGCVTEEYFTTNKQPDICVVLRSMSLRAIGGAAASEIERLREAEREVFQKYVDANEVLADATKALEDVAAAKMPGEARRIARLALQSLRPAIAA